MAYIYGINKLLLINICPFFNNDNYYHSSIPFLFSDFSSLFSFMLMIKINFLELA